MNPKLQGRRSYVLQRCSTPGQVGNSLNNQTKSLENLIAEHQIVVVGQEDLAGVTGSIPGARDDIDKIIRLKRGGLDFDLLLLANTDRFTRAGAFHANSMLYDLEGEGISVYFAAEGLISDDRLHRTILSFLFDAAQQTAIAISRGATMGNTNSYLEGRSPYAHRPPYGLDRMYSVNGKDMHLLRNLADGTQQMLDPKTLEVIRTFGVIRDLWWRRTHMGLMRAIGNVTVQRLDPDLQGRMPRPLETTKLGGRRICWIFPAIPKQGHWFTLSQKLCRDIARAADAQTCRSEAVRAEVILLAVWRAQEAGGDPRLHTWAIPAEVVAVMAQRVGGRPNRCVRIPPPVDEEPTVWLKQDKGQRDPTPIPIHAYYRCWTLSPAELGHIQAAELIEVKQTRKSQKQCKGD